jgi:hypothetical protein
LNRKRLVAVILALTLLLPATAALAKTHLNSNTANMVTLRADDTGHFFRVKQGGALSTTEFKPATGQVFIAMDVEWKFTDGSVGTAYSLALQINGTGGTLDAYTLTGLMNPGMGGASGNMGSGFVVGPTGTLTVTVSSGLSLANSTIFIHGYIATASGT